MGVHWMLTVGMMPFGVRPGLGQGRLVGGGGLVNPVVFQGSVGGRPSKSSSVFIGS